ncbi:MAG: phosphoribosylanthranilate isomerase [Methanomassiliicoccus sp.]|nr:phosphoribosylanthranilate isomerase [Methanomassiliicoccus sp.]
MTEVKVCGLMSERDVRIAEEADHLGFVVATGTRRSLEPSAARDLMAGAGKPTVAVVTSADPAFIIDLVRDLRPGAVQLSGPVGREAMEAVTDEAGCEIWAVVHIDDAVPTLDLGTLSLADRVVLDTATPQGGGSGRTHDLDVSARLVRELGSRTSLAGGLTPENVAAAVRKVRPSMVDVSSGVETQGKKDAAKIRRFIDEVRGCH